MVKSGKKISFGTKLESCFLGPNMVKNSQDMLETGFKYHLAAKGLVTVACDKEMAYAV